MRTRIVIFIVLFFLLTSNILDWFYPSVLNDYKSRLLPQVFIITGFLILLCFYLIFIQKRQIILKAFPFWLLLWIIIISTYAFCYNEGQDSIEIIMSLAKMIIWSAYGLLFFLISYNTSIEYKSIYRWAVLFSLLICCRSLYLLYVNNFQLVLTTDYTKEVANQNSYLLLWCVPFLWVYKDESMVSKISISLVVITLLLSMKRGPLLAISLAVVFTELIFSNKSILMNIKKLIQFFLILAVIYSVLSVFYNQFLERFNDISNPDVALGHGRLEYWPLLLNEYLGTDIIHHIFGFGYLKASNFLSNNYMDLSFAHSDWIEILFDFGVAGVCIFGCVHLGILKAIRLSKKNDMFCISKNLFFGWILFFVSNIYTVNTINKNAVWIFIFFGYWTGVIYRNLYYEQYYEEPLVG